MAVQPSGAIIMASEGLTWETIPPIYLLVFGIMIFGISFPLRAELVFGIMLY